MAATATITVLMTDLVGSTELLRHGADACDELRRAHLTAVRSALDQHRGEEVKSTGDGIMATFASAADAILAAEAIQQTTERARQRDARTPLVRVGVSAGEATSEDGDWYGTPVIEAARICAEAEGGQVLATGVVALLVGSRLGDRFVALGHRRLKGFDEPVAVVEVPWRPTADPDALPLPPAATLAAEGFLVGREDELAALREAWRSACDSSRRTVLLGGEPGVGKTRLVGELAVAAHTAGATVLWGRCDEEAGIAFQPFAEALRPWASAAPGPEPSNGGPDRTDRQLLARLVPELGSPSRGTLGPAGSEDPEGERYLLLEAVAKLLADLARDDPVLLVIDDVHWAAAPTLLLLRHLARDPRPARMLIVATYRDTDLDRTHPLADVLADLRRESAVERQAVTGLDEPGVIAYLGEAAGTDLGPAGAELARAIHQETEGNPFFIGQILRHLTESGAVAQRDGLWTMAAPIEEIGIPEGVREVVGRRLNRLSELANRVLAIAAVLGREFDLRVLDEVTGSDRPDSTLEVVEEAVAAHLLDEVGRDRFTFSHAIVRQTLLHELTAARRARLHRRIGEVLLRDPDVAAGLVAHHLCAGIDAGCVADAVTWTVRAMEESRMRLAVEEAVALGERALAALELIDDVDPELRARLLLPFCGALQYSGDIERSKALAAEAAAAARAARNPVLLAEAAGNRASWAQAGVSDPEASALLTEALAGLGPQHRVQRGRLLAVRALYRGVNHNQGEAAIVDAREAVELLRRERDVEALLGALFVQGSILQGGPDLGPQRAVLREVLKVEATAPEPVRRFNRLGRNRLAAVIAMRSGDRGDVERAIADLHDTGRLGGTGRIPRVLGSMWQAMLHLSEGRFEDASDHAAVLLELAEKDVNFQNSWAALAYRIALEQGQAVDLVPVLQELVAATPDLVALQIALARALVAAGSREEARPIVQALTRDGCAAVPRDLLLSYSLVELVEICALLGERSAATTLHQLLLPYEGQLQVTAWGVHCLGAVDRFLALAEMLIGHHDAADAHFGSALALEESIGATALAARTRRWWAELLGRRAEPADLERAQALLTTAEEMATSVGQAGLLDELADLRTGLTTPT